MSDRVDKAAELFCSGYNCSQAVFCAFADIFGFDNETALKISSGFGGGFGRMREVCGAFSAVTMLAGLKYDGDIEAPSSKAEIYKKIRELADRFKDENGSIICRENLKVPSAPKSHIPEERTQKYMETRPCLSIVKSAAEIAQSFLCE